MTFSQNKAEYIFWSLGIFILGISVGFFGVFYIDKSQESPSLSQEVQEIHKNSHFFDNVKIQKVYNIISERFYGFDQKTQKDLEDAFLSAMVKSLWDKHSEYFTAEQAKELEEHLNNNFVGIGAVISEHSLGMKIDKIIKDSPAEKFWLKVGDIMTLVNDKSLEGLTPEEGVRFVRWEEWSNAHIVFYRDGKKQSVDVTRGVVLVPSVDSRVLDGGKVGYIQINSFSERTSKELKMHLDGLFAQDVAGIILDVRFNGGGYLSSAQDILSEFLPKRQPIAIIKENHKQDEIIYTNFFSFPNTKVPLVVLVNDLSASASEILAGALQDYNRAIIVGTKTYGKGSVQEIVELDEELLKLTIAHWYTPKWKGINGEGIHPDVVVDFEEEDYVKSFDRQLEVAKNIVEEILSGKNADQIKEEFKKSKK